MIDISTELAKAHTSMLSEAYKKGIGAPLFIDAFFHEMLNQGYSNAGITYPYTIKIPRSIPEMLRGDFSPAKEIVIEEPIMLLGNPVWFGNSTKGVYLRLGYLNGDKRYISDVQLNDNTIHGILGGITGQGKSVALNAMIFGMAMEYAPWEVKLTMADAKKVEFKRYAFNAKLPHISSIAATEDASYLISTIDAVYSEMTMINNVFTKAGVQNIKAFREKTGLTLPHNVIVIDEFQTMFKTAGNKKAAHITKVLDLLARLGRNTGYHLYLASQSLDGGDVPQATLDQIAVRCCLGAREKASEAILGNNAASTNVGRKGRLIVNTKSQDKNKGDNMLYTVPLQTDEQFEAQGAALEELGKKIGFSYVMSFYDEAAIKELDEYVAYLDEIHDRTKTIFLGDPAFVSDDPIQCLRINLEGKSCDNIVVLSGQPHNLKRAAWMLAENVKMMKATNTVLYLDKDTVYEYKLDALNDVFLCPMKSMPSDYLNDLRNKAHKRSVLLDVDVQVFDGSPCVRLEETNDMMDSWENSEGESLLNEKYTTEVYRKRANKLFWALRSPITAANLGLSLPPTVEECVKLDTLKKYISSLLDNYELLGCGDRQLKREDLPFNVVWLLHPNRTVGLGRDPVQKQLSMLKTLMMDAPLVNMVFISFHLSMEDFESFKSACRYYILDRPENRDLNRIKCEDYPDGVPEKVSILFDNQAIENLKCLAFKKILLPDEILN